MRSLSYKGYIVIKKEFQECKGEYKYKPIHNRLLTLDQANRVGTGEKLYITITSRYGMVSDIITEKELKQCIERSLKKFYIDSKKETPKNVFLDKKEKTEYTKYRFLIKTGI